MILFLVPHRGLPQTPRAASPASIERQIQSELVQGPTSQADDDLKQLLSQPRLESGLLMRVGIAFGQKGLYSEASRAFARCVHDDPALFEGHYNLALALLAQNHLQEALTAIDKAPHTTEQDSTARLYLRGKIEAQMGRAQSAEHDLSTALENDPGNENYALDLGLFYLRVHAYPQAEQVFARGSGRNPHSTYLLLGLALAQFLAGRASASEESARRLIALAPDFSTARLLLGFALYFDGDLEGARKIARDGIALANPNPYLYYLDAVALMKQHDQSADRILADLSSAERLLPSCALCYVASGKVRQEHDDLPRAVADFQTAVNLAPDLSEGWYHLAGAYEQQGKKERAADARRHFQQMKTSEDEREKEAMQGVFLQSLSGDEGSQ